MQVQGTVKGVKVWDNGGVSLSLNEDNRYFGAHFKATAVCERVKSLNKGDSVTVEYKENSANGKTYYNISDVKSNGGGSNSGGNNAGGGDRNNSIIAQTCLKAAASVVAGTVDGENKWGDQVQIAAVVDYLTESFFKTVNRVASGEEREEAAPESDDVPF